MDKKISNGVVVLEPGDIAQVANPVDDNYGRLGLVMDVVSDDEIYLWFEYPSDGNFYNRSQLVLHGVSDVTVKNTFGWLTVSRNKRKGVIHWPMPMLGDDETKAIKGQKIVTGIHSEV